MKIELRREPGAPFVSEEIEKGVTIEDIYKGIKEELPYTIIAAKVNNSFKDLTFRLEEPCSVELLDIRTQAANLIYQHSLSLLYIKAVKDVMGDVKVEIENSLNKGLFTQVRTAEVLTCEEVAEVEARMHKLVEMDIPLERGSADVETGFEILKEEHLSEKIRLLSENDSISKVTFYSIDDYKDFFYSLMVPSTGYLKYFELKKYRRGILLRFPHPSAPDKMPPYVDEEKLYQAFGEQKNWDKLLGVNYVADLNEKIESGDYREMIQLSEALHEKKIAEIADIIKIEGKRIILIAGPSSSGKTTFARRLCIQLKVNGLDPLYMGTDDYFVERENTPLDENGERNYEDLSALDIELFNQNMNGLLAGEEVDLPEFDFMTGHKVYGKRITSINKNQPIVIEGIHALNEKLTEFIPKDEKIKIYISPLTQLNIDSSNRIPTTDERMLRRMVRDNLYRGHNAQSTIADWPKVRKGEDKNIFPYSNEADIFFNSYHVYEIAVLKKYAEPLLEQIKPEESEYAEAQRMLQFLRFFKKIDDDSIIVNNSIIREFIGGSIFVD